MHLSDLNCKHDPALEVRQYMHFLRLDTKQLARLLGVHYNSVGKWMSGNYPPPDYAINFLKALAYTETIVQKNSSRGVQEFIAGRIDVEIVPVIKEVV